MAKRSRIKDFLWRHSAGLAFLVMVVFVAFIGFVGYTYVVITKKFDSARRWDLPSRIYSDATPIVPGMTIPRSLLEPKLNHVGYHEVQTRVTNPGEYRYADGDARDLPAELRVSRHRVSRAAGGHRDGWRRRSAPSSGSTTACALRGIRIEPELITSIYNNEMEDRLPVSLSAVPKVVCERDHLDRGQELLPPRRDLDPRHVRRAASPTSATRTLTHGGSTLTQQLIKNLYPQSRAHMAPRRCIEALDGDPARGALHARTRSSRPISTRSTSARTARCRSSASSRRRRSTSASTSPI